MRSATSLAVIAVATLFAARPARAADGKPAPTFSKDVAPIFYKSCVECHRPTMFAPMSLVTYDEARPWARSIKQRVVARAMPPWGADAPHGVFKNDPSLSQAEIDTIAAWVDAGAPKGEDKDLPSPPQFADGWTIGKPDAVFTMEEDFDIPASGAVEYQYIRVPTHLTDDKWIHIDGSYASIVRLVTTGFTKAEQVDPKYQFSMNPRGGVNLTDAEINAVAAYVWSLSHTKR